MCEFGFLRAQDWPITERKTLLAEDLYTVVDADAHERTVANKKSFVAHMVEFGADFNV